MSFLRGLGTGPNDPLIIDSFDDFIWAINHDSEGFNYYQKENGEILYKNNGDTLPSGTYWSTQSTIRAIALDPDAKNKIIDCNSFSIGVHGQTNYGLRVFDGNSQLLYLKTIYGNDWIFKNFWLYGYGNEDKNTNFFNFDMRTVGVSINKLHFLNCFHLVSSSKSGNFFGSDDSNSNETTTYLPEVTFNDCKFSILSTGGNNYNMIKTSTHSDHPTRYQFNRCSFNIIATNSNFQILQFMNGTSVYYNQSKFYNCNFRLNILYSNNLFYPGNTGGNDANIPKFYFCKFTGNIYGKYSQISSFRNRTEAYLNDVSLLHNQCRTKMFTNCVWQLNFPDRIEGSGYGVGDSTLGLYNSDHSLRAQNVGESYTPKMQFMSKEDLLTIDKLTAVGFPVMSKIIPDDTEV